MKKPFYITTPIYFANNIGHIGHSYTTVAADTMARYKKMRGFDVCFLTGMDEHGQKIAQMAESKGVSPKAYVDGIAASFQELWKTLCIDNDIFIRTTDEYHEQGVKKIFKQLFDQGDIYKSSYEGKYCTPCETFFTDHQLKDGNCPDCGRPVQIVQEESYFFRLSKYGERLMEHIENNPEFILPKSRQNEMVNNFLKPGLEDLCVSRTSFTWGIPVEFDPSHVVYVWIDALSNYITALGYGTNHDEAFQTYWPADVHLVGKEIVRFHTIIWPAMLMALNLPLPKQIFGHGWLLMGATKMSKSLGNVVDPMVLVNRYGVDAIRYFLLREIPFGQDGNFTNEALISRINSDLANDLGNLLSRTVGMIDKYFDGVLPKEQTPTSFDEDLQKITQNTTKKVEHALDNMLFSDALTDIFALVRRANKYIDETAPWVLAKDPLQKSVLANVLYQLAEVLRKVAIFIAPFMPNTPQEIYAQLNISDEKLKTWNSLSDSSALPTTVCITKGNIVFPRIDMEKELQLLQEQTKQDEVTSTEQSLKQNESKEKKQLEPSTIKEAIGIDDFAKLELKTGCVLACEAIEGTKLLKSQIDIGGEIRQIVSGIAKWYTPQQMVGKTVVVVVNLKPIKLRGVLSEGMILAASDELGNLALVTTDTTIAQGANVR